MTNMFLLIATATATLSILQTWLPIPRLVRRIRGSLARFLRHRSRAIMLAVGPVFAPFRRLRGGVASESEVDWLLDEFNRAEPPETAQERADQQNSLAKILDRSPADVASKTDVLGERSSTTSQRQQGTNRIGKSARLVLFIFLVGSMIASAIMVVGLGLTALALDSTNWLAYVIPGIVAVAGYYTWSIVKPSRRKTQGTTRTVITALLRRTVIGFLLLPPVRHHVDSQDRTSPAAKERK
ncbi:hypothetical protein ACPZ19_51150 [Amycolatopsis lurida]